MSVETPEEIAALVQRARAGERRAASRIATELERAGPAMPALIRALEPHLGQAVVIGFTGPPGAGKSTLVDAYVRHLRAAGHTVGIIAVDPSSPVSGGAILGDRIRMAASLGDDAVTMRSLASQGALGGLSPAAVRLIDALDGLGKQVIVLETVGTGQNEIDVAEVADVRVVLAAPGLGDGIQAMKSGLLEIADVLVVNQADRPGADETHRQLLTALSLRSVGRTDVKVLRTVATTGTGLAALGDEIARLAAIGLARPAAERRRQRAHYLVARAVRTFADDVLAGGAVVTDTDAILAGRVTVAEVARGLIRHALGDDTRR